ncbi:hypothetical protein RHECNPAF_430091 [Rhizobium etli CNPAF512]|nr:hypothetical protein RHECNPAF_430091 [Rhizobium etli CNPAF512]
MLRSPKVMENLLTADLSPAAKMKH